MPSTEQPTLTALWAKSAKRPRPEPVSDDDEDDLVVIARVQEAERARRVVAAAAVSPTSSPQSPLSPREVGQQRAALRAIIEAPSGAAAQREYDAATGQWSSSWPAGPTTEPAVDDDLVSSDYEDENDNDDDAGDELVKCADDEDEEVADPNQVIEAAVYEWRFNNTAFISPDHPLFDIPYFGQVARSVGTAEQQCKDRWREEEVDSRRNPKKIGLYAMIAEFGKDAATRRPLEQTTMSILEARKWANERERALIAEHGGPLRDYDLRCQQTLNLTLGGQGTAVSMFYAQRALAIYRWTRKVKPALQAFYEREGHLRVPSGHIEEGVRLGSTVADMRHSRTHLAGFPERMEWLLARGWVESEKVARWEDIKAALESFFLREGHLRVKNGHWECGLRLGEIVRWIKERQYYIRDHPERIEWLRQHGWAEKEREEQWRDVQCALLSYYNREGHLMVPKRHMENGMRLGGIVSDMRQGHFLNGHPERKAWVNARGWVVCVGEWRWQRAKAALESFLTREGHLQVPLPHKENGYALGSCVWNIRKNQHFVKGHPKRAQWCYNNGFRMRSRDEQADRRLWLELGVELRV